LEFRFVAHSRRVVSIARQYGWRPAARYTNLRDVRAFRKLGFLDIPWRNYEFSRHLAVTRSRRPVMTVARDVEDADMLGIILDEAGQLAEHSQYVVIVPKDPRLEDHLDSAIPSDFLLGYSVPTRYGGVQPGT